MDRDFVWEADYGNRKDVIKVTKKILKEQSAKSLQCVSYFVNNNLYNLEFYVLVSYDIPSECEIEMMRKLFENIGLKYRLDITLESLIREIGNRRFNTVSFQDDLSVDSLINNIFLFPEREELEKKGYVMESFSRRREIFISHSSEDKKIVKKIIPYLNGANHTVWFDEFNIDVGDSLYEKIDAGIVNAFVVIFWITEKFLQSKWCSRELDLAEKNKVI